MPLIHAELRRIAENHLRRQRPDHTLQPTALVHEAYIRMIGNDQPDYRSRAHFLGIAAHVMREVLVDHARSRAAGKRGGGEPVFSLDESMDGAIERPVALIAVDDALRQLARVDGRKSRLIEMRFFGGMTAEDSADVLQLPVEKIRSELRVAQAWLQRELDSNFVLNRTGIRHTHQDFLNFSIKRNRRIHPSTYGGVGGPGREAPPTRSAELPLGVFGV